VNCNWKIAQEAFHEGYHVMATHPQLTLGKGEGHPTGGSEYTAFENGHGRFQGRPSEARMGGVAQGLPPDEFNARMRILWEGQDAMVLERDLRVFEGIRRRANPGENFGNQAIDALFEHAAGAGIPMPPPGEHLR